MSQEQTTWETTKEQNLLRNRASGKYYGRFTLSGKQKWVNLETDVWSVAKLAAWLGHADGGALLMRVYAHHRRAHSIAQAAKVLADI